MCITYIKGLLFYTLIDWVLILSAEGQLNRCGQNLYRYPLSEEDVPTSRSSTIATEIREFNFITMMNTKFLQLDEN